MISSSQNTRVKLVRSLSGRSKERREAEAFIAEGVRLMEEALAANWPVRFLLYTDEVSDRGVEVIKRARAKRIETEEVDRALLASLSETENSQGMLAVLNDSRIPIPKALK